MLKKLPTLLSCKAFAVFERLAAEAKEDYKTLTKALTTAFGGDTTGKHLAMMAFRSRARKPDENIQVFAHNLEALLIKARNAKNRKRRQRCPTPGTIYRRSSISSMIEGIVLFYWKKWKDERSLRTTTSCV